MSAEFPIALSTQVSLAAGFPVIPNADDLQNDFQCDIQIEEIRVLLFCNSGIDANSNPMPSLAPLVRMSLKMGRVELTDSFIPLWLFGTRMQSMLEVAYGFQNSAAPATNQTVWDFQRWKLPVPMIVPNGSTLLPQFVLLMPNGKTTVTNPSDSPITAYITMIGRSLGSSFKRPSKLKVPYVTAFIANPVTGGLQSGDNQLVNRFTVPFHIQRFIGRIALSDDPASNEFWMDAEGGNSGAGNSANSYSLTLVDSNGYYLVKDMTPWEDVFDPQRKALNANRVLEPRGWYRAQLNKAAIVNGAGIQGTVPMISMVGWREEEVAA